MIGNLDIFNQSFTSVEGIILLFVKVFAVIFVLLFFVYTLVLLRQTTTMGKTYQTKKRTLFFYISLLQVIIALILILFAFTVI